MVVKFIVLLASVAYHPCFSQHEADSLVHAAEDKFAHSDIRSSITDIDSALKIAPKHGGAYYLRARIKLAEEQYQSALTDLSLAIEYNPDQINAYVERARLYVLLGYHRNYALNDINAAILLDKLDSRLYVEKARIITRTTNNSTRIKDYEWAIDNMDKAIAYDYKNSTLYRIRADYKFEIDQQLEALRDIDKAIELDPNDPENYDSRGTMRLFIEEYQGAIDDFTKAIDLSPEEGNHYRKRAHAYYNSGRYWNSIDDLTNTVILQTQKLENGELESGQRDRIVDTLKNVYLIRGSAFMMVDKEGEACSDFRRARELGERKAVNYISKYCR